MTAKVSAKKRRKSRTYSYRRGRVVFLVAASLFMTAISLMIAVFDDVAIFNMFGLIGAVFFGASTVATARALFETDPVVKLGPDGVHDRRMTDEPIPWTSFRQGQALDERSAPAVALQLVDGQKHLVEKPWWHGLVTGTFRSSRRGVLTIGLFSLDTDAIQFVRDVVAASDGHVVIRQ